MKEKTILFTIRLFIFSLIAYMLLLIGEYLSIRHPEYLTAYVSVTVGTVVATLFLLWEG